MIIALVTAMNSLPKRLAHVLERIGLAMVGSAAGLFVGIHTGSGIDALMNQGFLIILTIVGAAGFYLGIDTPRHRFQGISVGLSGSGMGAKVDAAELLTAVGTFLAASAAFISVALIVFGRDGRIASSSAVLVTWLIGVAMQIGAGAIARIRR
jgi:hypothetical protein